MFIDYESIGAPPDSGEAYYVYSDQRGAPCLIENARGERVWEAKIAPFGHCELVDAKLEFNLRFPGHYHDPELRLHYNRNRYYDPVLGRYIQSDPIGIGGGQNLYAYCVNPLLSVDVLGLGEDEDHGYKPRDRDDDSEAIVYKPRYPPDLLDLVFGKAHWPWMVRMRWGEGRYPPETQVVGPGRRITLDRNRGKYLYIIDESGVMHIAPERGSSRDVGGRRRRTSHVDLAERQRARMSGEIYPDPNGGPNDWIMNDDSGRYSNRVEWADPDNPNCRNITRFEQAHDDPGGALNNAHALLNEGDLGDSNVTPQLRR